MLKTWTRCEKTGDAADDDVARSASRSFRNASRIMVSSVDGGGGVGDAANPLLGDEQPCLGGGGMYGRMIAAVA